MSFIYLKERKKKSKEHVLWDRESKFYAKGISVVPWNFNTRSNNNYFNYFTWEKKLKAGRSIDLF